MTPAGIPPRHFWLALDRITSTRYSSIGVALMRISLGLVALYGYAVSYPDRLFLWGAEGVWRWSSFTEHLRESGSFSLYALSPSRAWFEVAFHLGILIAIAFTLGWGTRVITVVHWLAMWSLFERNPSLLDGGDVAMRIALVYFIAVDSGRHLSIDALRRRGPEVHSLRYRLGSLVHNAGVLALILQISIVYLASALYKVQGEQWQDGTALHYILQWTPYHWPGWSEKIYSRPILVGLLTYGTVLFQLSWPYLLLNRHTRVVAVLGAIAMHAGIGIVLGLITFSWIIASFELVVISDRQYRSGLAFLRRYAPTFRARPSLRPTEP